MTGDTPLPPRREAVRLKNARRHAPSSQRWLSRQLNDPYVQAAKTAGWRSRAAFKLLELDDKYHLIGKNCRVVDLGAAPGGWSQVALARGAAQVIGIDLLPIPPIPGAEFIEGDFMAEGVAPEIARRLGGQADLVLSDMAPNTTGHVATDHIRIMALAELALTFSTEVLRPGGAFVAKLFQGGAERGMLDTLKLRFRTVRHAKPPASRKDSKEMYVVATGFRPGILIRRDRLQDQQHQNHQQRQTQSASVIKSAGTHEQTAMQSETATEQNKYQQDNENRPHTCHLPLLLLVQNMGSVPDHAD